MGVVQRRDVAALVVVLLVAPRHGRVCRPGHAYLYHGPGRVGVVGVLLVRGASAWDLCPYHHECLVLLVLMDRTVSCLPLVGPALGAWALTVGLVLQLSARVVCPLVGLVSWASYVSVGVAYLHYVLLPLHSPHLRWRAAKSCCLLRGTYLLNYVPTRWHYWRVAARRLW